MRFNVNYQLYYMLLVAYLLGSLSFAIIVSKLMKMDDPRSYGSQNAGATNVMRSGNKKAAVFTLLGDLLKGLAVVLIARILVGDNVGGDAIVGLCGVLVVLGHIYPIFFKFKGGKGVATAIGVLLGFNLWLFIALVLTWFAVFKISKTSSLAAIIATALSPLYAYIFANGAYFDRTTGGTGGYFGATLMIAFFVIYKHKENIVRLLTGKEHSFKKDDADPDKSNLK